MNLNQLRDQAYSIAVAHGWHKETKSRKHWLAMIMTEVAEAIQADRQDYHARIGEYNERKHNYSKARAFEVFIKNTVEDEMADIVIRCLDLAGLNGIDLSPMDSSMMRTAISKVKKYITEMNFTEWTFELLTAISVREEYSLDVTIGEILTLVFAKADLMDVNIQWYIEKKMAYNKNRVYMHGKQY